MTTKIQHPKIMGCNKSSSNRKFIAIQPYLRKKEKAQINNLKHITPRISREGRTDKTKTQQKVRNHKDQSRNQ